MKILAALIVCVAFGCSITSTYAWDKAEPFEFGYIELPPFGYTNNNGEVSGYLADLSRLVFERMELPVYYRGLPATRLYHQISTGHTTMTMGPQGLHQLADTAYQSTEPAITLTLSLYHRSDTAPVTSLEELAGKRVVLMQGYSYGTLGKFFEQATNSNEVIRARTHTSAIKMLLHDRADYLLSYQVPVDTVIARQGLGGLRSEVIGTIPVHFFVSHEVPEGEEIIEQWDQHLIDLQKKDLLPPMDFYIEFN